MSMRMPGFQVLPPVIKNILIVNALVFFAQLTFENSQTFRVDDFFGLHDVRSDLFRPHQLVTYMFLHGGFFHILFNMLAVWMFGSALEQVWGGKRFLIFYMATGIGAGLLHLGVLYMEFSSLLNDIGRYDPSSQQSIVEAVNRSVTMGASGAVFGILAAFGYLFPNTIVYVYFFPVKAKFLVIGYAVMEISLGIQNSAGDNVAHWAHIGGAVVGIILVLIWNKTNRRNFY